MTDSETKLEELGGWKVNDLLDCKDTVQKWCEARVIKIDPNLGLWINYIGWSEKWNEWIQPNSDRIAPYRTYTTGSTAPTSNLSAYNLSGSNLEKFQECLKKLDVVFTKIETRYQNLRDQKAVPAVETEKLRLTDEEITFLNSENSGFVSNTLNAVIDDPAWVQNTFAYYQKNITLAVHFIQLPLSDKESKLVHVMNEQLVRILNSEPGGDKRFFTKYGASGAEDNSYQGLSGAFAVRPPATGSGDSLKIVSAYLIGLLNLFGELGGFTCLASKESFTSLAALMSIFKSNRTYLRPETARAIAASVKIGPALIESVRSLTDEELKNINRELFRIVMDNLKDMAQYYHSLNRSEEEPIDEAEKEKEDLMISEQQDSLGLEIVLRLMKCQVLEKQINALADLHDVIKQVRKRERDWQNYELALQNYALQLKKWQDVEAETITEGAPGAASVEGSALPVKPQKPERSWLTSSILVDWIERNQIASTLLHPDTHEAILARAPPILKFLSSQNRLPVKYVLDLWSSTSGKNEGFVRTVYDAIADLASELPTTILKTLYERIQQCTQADLTDFFLAFVSKFTLNAVRSNQREIDMERLKNGSETHTTQPEYFGLALLWDLIESESKLPNDLQDANLNHLSDLLQKNEFESQRLPALHRCFEGMQKGTNVLQLLKLARTLISLYPERENARLPTRKDLILQLHSKYDLIQLVMSDLDRYHEQAAQAKLASSSSSSALLVNHRPHAHQLQTRLDFFEFITNSTSPALQLTHQHIEKIWEVCVEKYVQLNDRDIAWAWISKMSTSPAFSHSLGELVFHQLLCNTEKIDVPNITEQGFHCFEALFVHLNTHSDALIRNQRGQLRVADAKKMVGMDTIWLLALTAKEPKVAELSRNMIVNLHHWLDESLGIPFRKETNVFFFRAMFSRLLQCREALLDINVSEKEKESRRKLIAQLLHILEHYLAEWDSLMEKEMSNLRFSRKEEAEDLIAAQHDLAQHPKSTLANDPEFFDALFLVAGLGGDSAQRVWKLLGRLPLNQRIEEGIRKLSVRALRAEQNVHLVKRIVEIEGGERQEVVEMVEEPESEIDWEQLLPSASLPHLYYAIQIVQNILNPSVPIGRQMTDREKDTLNNWMVAFITKGGYAHLYSTLLDLNLAPVTPEALASASKPLVFSDLLFQQCLDLLLRTLYQLTHSSLETAPLIEVGAIQYIDSVVDYTRLASRLLTVMHSAVVSSQSAQQLKSLLQNTRQKDGEKSETETKTTTNTTASFSATTKQESLLLSHALKTLNAVIAHKNESIQAVYDFNNWQDIVLNGLLEHPASIFREEISKGILQLCVQIDLADDFKSPALIVLPHLLSCLNLIMQSKTYANRSIQYFELLQKLLVAYSNLPEPSRKSSQLDTADLLMKLADTIVQYESAEHRSEDIDYVLVGLMNTTTELIRQNPDKRSKLSHLVAPLFQALFELPSVADRLSASIPPKCKSQPSRRACFSLLAEVVKGDAANIKQLLEKLYPLHLHARVSSAPAGSARANAEEWDFEARSEEKSVAGYVGMKNHGCICYMNSLLQQLFMIPELRKNLLSIDVSTLGVQDDKDKEDSVLYQLQWIMAYLQESEKIHCDPIGLCRAFKDWDGNPINVSIQEDSAGFFERLIEKIEDSVKNTPHANAIKDVLLGRFADQFIGKGQGCNHKRERATDYYSIAVNVKNKKTLQESLKEFTQGELLAGSNAYKCSECNAKVDTLKRCVIKDLPNTLVIVLKRFEMDYETMQPSKANDRLEFPHFLDMKPYTLEGLPKEADESKDGKEAEVEELPQRPNEYYQYVLRGVVVHTGSVSAGHYYSYIQERSHPDSKEAPRWFEFNDTRVSPFNPVDIEDQCFGGSETRTYNHGGRIHTYQADVKSNNAYIIFYDRVKPIRPEHVTPPASQPERTCQFTAPANVGNRHLVPVPQPIFDAIWSENTSYFQDRVLFDSTYFDFVSDLIQRSPFFTTEEKSTEESDVEQVSCSLASLSIQDEQTCIQLLQFCIHFLFQTLARSRSKDQFAGWCTWLKVQISKLPSVCSWLLGVMANSSASPLDIPAQSVSLGASPLTTQTQSNQWNRDFFLNCPHLETRRNVANVIIQALQTLSPSEQESYSMSEDELKQAGDKFVCRHYVDSLLVHLPYCLKHYRRFNQYFRILWSFAQLGQNEATYLITRHDLISKLIDLYLGDESPVSIVGVAVDSKGKRVPAIGVGHNAPDWAFLIACLRSLVCASTLFGSSSPVRPPTTPAEIATPVPLSEISLELLSSTPFLRKFMAEAINRKRGAHVTALLSHLCYENKAFSSEVIRVLALSVKEKSHDDYRPLFRVAMALALLEDSIAGERVDELMSSLFAVLEAQQQYWKPNDFALDHMIRMAKKSIRVTQWLASHREQLDWAINWITKHPTQPKIGEQGIYVQKPRTGAAASAVSSYNRWSVDDDEDDNLSFRGIGPILPGSYASVVASGADSTKYESRPSLPGAQKLEILTLIKEQKEFDTKNGSDSDEDLSERKFALDEYWEVLDASRKWTVAQIVEMDENRVKVHIPGTRKLWDGWIAKDSRRIARLGSHTDGKPAQDVLVEGADVESATALFRKSSSEDEGIQSEHGVLYHNNPMFIRGHQMYGHMNPVYFQGHAMNMNDLNTYSMVDTSGFDSEDIDDDPTNPFNQEQADTFDDFDYGNDLEGEQ